MRAVHYSPVSLQPNCLLKCSTLLHTSPCSSEFQQNQAWILVDDAKPALSCSEYEPGIVQLAAMVTVAVLKFNSQLANCAVVNKTAGLSFHEGKI